MTDAKKKLKQSLSGWFSKLKDKMLDDSVKGASRLVYCGLGLIAIVVLSPFFSSSRDQALVSKGEEQHEKRHSQTESAEDQAARPTNLKDEQMQEKITSQTSKDEAIIPNKQPQIPSKLLKIFACQEWYLNGTNLVQSVAADQESRWIFSAIASSHKNVAESLSWTMQQELVSSNLSEQKDRKKTSLNVLRIKWNNKGTSLVGACWRTTKKNGIDLGRFNDGCLMLRVKPVVDNTKTAERTSNGIAKSQRPVTFGVELVHLEDKATVGRGKVELLEQFKDATGWYRISLPIQLLLKQAENTPDSKVSPRSNRFDQIQILLTKEYNTTSLGTILIDQISLLN